MPDSEDRVKSKYFDGKAPNGVIEDRGAKVPKDEEDEDV